MQMNQVRFTNLHPFNMPGVYLSIGLFTLASIKLLFFKRIQSSSNVVISIGTIIVLLYLDIYS